MKKIMRWLLYPLLAVVTILLVREAVAQMPGRTPLVVVRFNQERVYYEQPLYQAVAKAVAIKPEVMLDVVSMAPSTGNNVQDANWQQLSSRHTQAVVGSLQEMGVPLSRMTITGQAQPGLRYDEVHIYVR